MTINFDKALGIHPQALTLRAERNKLLAANLANADTPGYKAKDVKFDSLLKGNLPANLPLSATRPGHLKPQGELQGGKVMYRIPSQSSLDGNTVEPHIEQGKFMENAMQYQASLTFINGKVASLLTALKGE